MAATKLPPLPPGAPGRPAAKSIKDKYGLIIVCPDEATQQKLYEALTALRHTPIRVVIA